jgi:RHS repeat-associated protein
MRVGSRKTASGVIAVAGRICVWFCDSQGREGIGDFAFVAVRFASGSPQDAMGSVIAQANGSGASTATIKYDGFGNILDASGPSASIDPSIGSEPRFHGMMLDAATGLYYVRARYYDSQTGRFVTRDPIIGKRSYPETYHPYTFVNSSPMIYVDPSGSFLMELTISAAVATTLAAIAIPAFNGYVRQARAVQAGTFIASGGALAKEGLKMVREDIGKLIPNDDRYWSYIGNVAIGLETGNPLTRMMRSQRIPSVWCGSGWNEVFVPDYPFGWDFAPSCMEHDICYGTCGANREQCDRELLERVVRMCEMDGNSKACDAVGLVYWWFIRNMGSCPFNEAQANCNL